MSWRSRIANVFRPNRLAIDLDDELAFHVAERIDELVAAGLSPEDARAEALRRFGNYPLQRDRTRDMDVIGWLESLLSDLRYGARQLRLNPGFATVAILSLALGIGANTAIFQLINALRLRSLPVERPWELATIDTEQGFYSAGWYAGRHTAFTYAQFKEFQRQQRAFSGLLAFGTARFNLNRSGEAQYANGLYVSANFLDVLGVRPTLGSGFGPEGDAPDCGRAGALLSYAFWQRAYGGDPAAVGRDIYLDGRMFPIIGVTPPAFFGLEPGRQFDVALPICADVLLSTDGKGRLARLDAWWLTLVGRLHPGWSLDRASAHLRQISPAVFRQTLPTVYRPADAGEVPEEPRQGHRRQRRSVGAARGVRESTVAASGGHGAGPVDRVCESRQPAAGARQRPPTRDGRSPGDGRVAAPPRRAARVRESAACGTRRRPGPRDRAGAQPDCSSRSCRIRTSRSCWRSASTGTCSGSPRCWRS